MEQRNSKLIMVLTITSILAILLSGAVSAYTTTFSADGKKIELSYDNVKSNLHYDVANTYKTGSWGYGKYTTVIVTGNDNKARDVYKKINYYNGIFRQSKTRITSGEDYIYNSQAWIEGTQIKEKLNGKLNAELSFRGSTISNVGNFKGQLINKDGTAKIGYWKNGIFYGQSVTTTTPKYQIYNGIYKIIKTTTITTTSYSNKDNRKSYITSEYLRNNNGEQIGLKTSGNSQGSELKGLIRVNYRGTIYIKNRYDSRDLYNEKFNTGNYYEKRTSSSTELNKTLPPYESLLI
jgi:hypothetical protein